VSESVRDCVKYHMLILGHFQVFARVFVFTVLYMFLSFSFIVKGRKEGEGKWNIWDETYMLD
jgi:hypothetical protein